MNRPSKPAYVLPGYAIPKPGHAEEGVQSGSKGGYGTDQSGADHAHPGYQASGDGKGSDGGSGNFGITSPQAQPGSVHVPGAKPVQGGGLESSSSIAWGAKPSSPPHGLEVDGTGAGYTLKTTAEQTGSGSLAKPTYSATSKSSPLQVSTNDVSRAIPAMAQLLIVAGAFLLA